MGAEMALRALRDCGWEGEWSGYQGMLGSEVGGAALKRTWPLALAPLPTPPSFASSLPLFLVHDHLLQGQGQGVHPR